MVRHQRAWIHNPCLFDGGDDLSNDRINNDKEARMNKMLAAFLLILIVIWVSLAFVNLIAGFDWWILAGIAVLASLFGAISAHEADSWRKIFNSGRGGKDASRNS